MPEKIIQPPINEPNFAWGLGWIVTNWDGYGTTPKMLGRLPIDTGGTENAPRYQFVLSKLKPGSSADAMSWLHQQRLNRIYRLDIDWGVSIHSSSPFYHISPDSVLGSAFAAIDTVIPSGGDQVALVWSEESVSDGAEIDCHFGPGFYASSGGTISYTDLGIGDLPGVPAAGDFRWHTFVARDTGDGTNIRVMGLCYNTTRTSLPWNNPASGTQLLTFTFDPVGKTVTEKAVIVQPERGAGVNPGVQIFQPHQLTEGLNVPLDGSQPQRILWCAGRSDWHSITPSVAPAAASTQDAMHVHGTESVWATTDLTMKTGWKRVYLIGHSQSHSPGVIPENGNKASASEPPSCRDIGVAFDESWQRLIPVAPDTDSSQDPVIMWPFKPQLS